MKLQEIHDSRKGPAVGFVTGGINNLLKQGQNISADMQNDEDKNFIKYITDAMYTDSKRDQVWLLLEVPQSSNAARGLSFFMIVVITMSIMVFVMESVPQLVYYGEPTQACQDVTKLYVRERSEHISLTSSGCGRRSSAATSCFNGPIKTRHQNAPIETRLPLVHTAF